MPSPTVDDVRRMVADAPISRLPALLDALEDDPRAGVRAAITSGRARLARSRAEKVRLAALYRLEADLHRSGHLLVAGVDEVGRGALAGPLTAAAVVLPVSPRIEGLDDSKRLTPERREEIALHVHSLATAIGLAHIQPCEIDSVGIGVAVKRAMMLALGQLSFEPDHVVIDGLPLGVFERETAVVKGDSKVAAIAAASVVAKVARDSLMRAMASEYPQYDFAINKGYGTSEHMEALTRHGMSPVHRRSFGPCGGTLPLF